MVKECLSAKGGRISETMQLVNFSSSIIVKAYVEIEGRVPLLIYTVEYSKNISLM